VSEISLEDRLKYGNLPVAEVCALRPISLNPTYLRRKDAGEYLKAKYGFGSKKTLAKLACLGGGPEFRKAGPAALYEPAALDAWALGKIGGLQKSTSDRQGA
jgi:hypothetical protein